MNGTSKRKPSGFTLVEILVVIVIIGILMGLAIPAITSALRTAKEAAIRNEINVLSQAIESYKLEHGEYPPDFADWDAVERHFRRAFPTIDNNELRILSQFTHYDSALKRMPPGSAGAGATSDPRVNPSFDHYPHAIDRAEALVFCLGGFSSEKNRPFTGQGGPLVLRSGQALTPQPTSGDYLLFQYNTERDTGFFDFDVPNLSITLLGVGGSAFAYSNDERFEENNKNPLPLNNEEYTTSPIIGHRYYADPFPVYDAPNTELPLVYFNSRDYGMAWGKTKESVWNKNYSRGAHFQNLYLPAGEQIAETGVARPYAANLVDTTPPTKIEGISVLGTVLQFAEEDKFQIVSCGLDNNYGGIVSNGWGSGSAGIPVYPGGQYYSPFTNVFSSVGPYNTVSSVDKYQDDLCLETHYEGSKVYPVAMQLDNVTNFTTRTLESDLP